jgi:hypothetical protein
MKGISITLMLGFIVAAWSWTAFAQDQNSCTELLRHGIYDKFRENSVSASASQLQTHICQAYQQYLQDRQAGQVKASYGLFGGEGAYSADKIAAVGQFMCADTSSSASASSGLAVASDILSQPALDAYRECLSLNAAGLKTNTVFREVDQGQITIELRYVAPVGAPPQTTINDIVLSPTDAFQCSGPLWDLKGQSNAVGTQSVAMSCTRNIAAAPFNNNGQTILAKANTITIMTTSGTVNRSLAPIIAAPPPVPLILPIGTIIAFSGTMAQATAQRQFGWWVCDGQTTINDPLADVAWRNKQTPDLKNRFIMGSLTATSTGGAAAVTIPTKHIEVKGTGFYPAQGNYPPMMGPPPNSTWGTFHPVKSEGDLPSFSVEYVPPFYSVIYLVKVK